jgi:DNA-binding LytR/AlgR family response regulator
MNCIAIDDEPLALKLLKHYADQTPAIHLTGTFTDPLEALSCIRLSKPELVFLDIRMPDISGIDVAQALEKNTLVVFTTAHPEYAVEGFELDVVDYLLKPFSFERFLKACTKAVQRLQTLSGKIQEMQNSEERSISIKCNYQNIRIPVNSILYIEAFDNYTRIVTHTKVFMPAMTMKTVQNLLPQDEFIRVHKSFIIPVAKIKSFNHDTVVTDKIQVPVGRTFLKDFLEKMNILKSKG